MEHGKLRRTLIPLEIINRYSVIDTGGDFVDLERTGYMNAMLESGFMPPDVVEMVNRVYKSFSGFNVIQPYIKAIQEYDLFGYDYQIPRNLQIEGWQALTEKIDRYLAISEIGVISCSIAGVRIAENTRKSTEKDLIKLVKDKRLEFSGGFPEGVYSWEALCNATHEQLCTLTIMFQAYVGAIEKGYLPEEHKGYAEIWRNHYKRNTLNVNAQKELTPPQAPAAPQQTASPTPPKLKGNVNAQKAQILKEIEEQKLNAMNINLKAFKAKFLLDYPEMTDRMFMKAWWALSGESKVRSDNNKLK